MAHYNNRSGVCHLVRLCHTSRHFIWCTTTFDSSSHAILVCVHFLFSSSEHKVLRVSYCDRSLSVVRKLFYLNIFSSETADWILIKLERNDPWVVPYQSCSNCSCCISWLRGQKIGFQIAIKKNLLVWNYKAQSFHIWYIASSRGPLPNLFKICPWG